MGYIFEQQLHNFGTWVCLIEMPFCYAYGCCHKSLNAKRDFTPDFGSLLKHSKKTDDPVLVTFSCIFVYLPDFKCVLQCCILWLYLLAHGLLLLNSWTLKRWLLSIIMDDWERHCSLATIQVINPSNNCCKVAGSTLWQLDDVLSESYVQIRQVLWLNFILLYICTSIVNIASFNWQPSVSLTKFY